MNSLQIRAELFNVFNRTYLNNPDFGNARATPSYGRMAYRSSGFGRINSGLHVSCGSAERDSYCALSMSDAASFVASQAALVVVGWSSLCSPPAPGHAQCYEALPPAKTGINFVHDNAQSPPVATCPNPWEPALRSSISTMTAGWTCTLSTAVHPISFGPNIHFSNALYQNNHDGTFTDATAECRRLGQRFRHRCFYLRLQRRRLRRICS